MKPVGCEVTRLDGAATAAILGWVRGGAPPAADLVPSGLQWLLAFSHGGVTWGRLEEDGWKLSSVAFPEVSPGIEESGLQELRLFGPEGELRIWPGAQGLEGRTFRDRPGDVPDETVAPRPDRWLLVGEAPATVRDGFVLVTGRAGRRQALPLVAPEETLEGTLPWSLTVRHHFERDERSGTVRVVLTRLLDLTPDPVRPRSGEGERS